MKGRIMKIVTQKNDGLSPNMRMWLRILKESGEHSVFIAPPSLIRDFETLQDRITLEDLHKMGKLTRKDEPSGYSLFTLV